MKNWLSFVCALFVMAFIINGASAGCVPMVFFPDGVDQQFANFNLTMPNSEVVNVDLKMKLLHPIKSVQKRNFDEIYTTTSAPANTDLSLDDIIRAFKQNLMKSEYRIGGLIQSSEPFYRHFLLQFRNVDVPIRCTYTPLFERQFLSIECYQYFTHDDERIYSNGDVELLHGRPNELVQNIRVEARHLYDYHQGLHMTIEGFESSSE